MSGYIVNIEDATAKNADYRRVLFTAKHAQLVLMNLKPGEEIGEEVHELDQFIRFEAGEGSVILDGKTHSVSDGFAVVIPAGTRHNVVNRSKTGDLSSIASTVLQNTRTGLSTKLSVKLMPMNIIISMAKRRCERLLVIKWLQETAARWGSVT